jgi:hypothetical protein
MISSPEKNERQAECVADMLRLCAAAFQAVSFCGAPE